MSQSSCKRLAGPDTPRSLVVGQGALFFGAGTDTTALALTYLAWEAARRPVIQDALRDELRGALPSRDPLLLSDVDVLRELPYLNAFIKVRIPVALLGAWAGLKQGQDGLRVWGPAATMFERVVPDGGVWLQGVFLPAGTVRHPPPRVAPTLNDADRRRAVVDSAP